MKLIVYPTPLEARCSFRHDNGTELIAVPDVDLNGRPCQSFEVPTSVPNGNGARLTIEADGFVPLTQRGILFTNSSLIAPDAMFTADDFTLQAAPVGRCL